MPDIHRFVEGSNTPREEPRSGSAILEDIWSRLWQEETVRSLDFNSLLVEVENGEVVLHGHVGKDQHRKRIEEIVAVVPGVTVVDNDLVSDQELAVKIAQVLSRDGRTRPYYLNVNVDHGWVTLIGEVPTKEALEIVKDVVSNIPEVRGILNPPPVSGQSITWERPVVQPDIGARVYNREGLVGIVTKVVINPLDKLVTHFVVRTGSEAAGRRVTAEFVLPVGVSSVINDENVILRGNVQKINVYPEFDQEQFSLSPKDWRSPFPYKPGEVFWKS